MAKTRSREEWKRLLPFITAFSDGAQINTTGMAVCFGDRMDFQCEPEDYCIAKPKERVPLEAEDWIKDGPWWVRADDDDPCPAMVVFCGSEEIAYATSSGNNKCSFMKSMNLQRRNATSDWMPCWKEKE